MYLSSHSNIAFIHSFFIALYILLAPSFQNIIDNNIFMICYLDKKGPETVKLFPYTQIRFFCLNTDYKTEPDRVVVFVQLLLCLEYRLGMAIFLSDGALLRQMAISSLFLFYKLFEWISKVDCVRPPNKDSIINFENTVVSMQTACLQNEYVFFGYKYTGVLT